MTAFWHTNFSPLFQSNVDANTFPFNQIIGFSDKEKVLKQSRYLPIKAYIPMQAQDRCFVVVTFFPVLSRMLSSYQLCLVVFVAAQLGESLSHSTDEEHSLDGFSSDTRCGWDCIITESNFGKECDPVFTRKRLIKFNVIYDLFVNTKCLNQTSYKTFGTFTDDFYVWIPANNTLSSFSRGIKGMWDLFLSCREEGGIRGFCNLEPGRPTTLASPTDLRTEAANTIKEKGYELITKNPWSHVVKVLLIWLSIVCTYYTPALLCLFSPTLVMESGILYIVLEGASLVSIRALVGNNVFFKDCSTVASTWYQTGKMFVVRLLFIAFLILLIAPGSIVFNIISGVSNISNLTHPFMRVCVTLYFIKAVCSLLLNRAVVSTEVRDCIACHELKSNPGGACLCVDLPRRISNHMKIQPLILAKCWSLFVKDLQIYFQIIFLLWKDYTRWVIRVSWILLFLPTFPFAFILSLLVSLVTFFFLFCSSTPLGVALNSSWPACLSKLYRSSLFVRLPALKICVQFIDYCVLWLAGFGGYCLLLLFFRGVLLTILLAFTTVLLFPEKSLPFAACFLLFCYYLFSNYSKFTDRYHDLSLTIFNFYKKQTDQISHEEVDINNPSDDKHNGGVVKIPKGLFDVACEVLMPIREALCLLFFKVVFISSFLFIVFYLTMQLDFDVKLLTKTVVAVLIGLFPRIICKYFEGERQKRMEALIIEEKAPKIVEAYLNNVQRANEGQENFGADTDEVSLQVVESDENIAIIHMY